MAINIPAFVLVPRCSINIIKIIPDSRLLVLSNPHDESCLRCSKQVQCGAPHWCLLAYNPYEVQLFDDSCTRPAPHIVPDITRPNMLPTCECSSRTPTSAPPSPTDGTAYLSCDASHWLTGEAPVYSMLITSQPTYTWGIISHRWVMNLFLPSKLINITMENI